MSIHQINKESVHKICSGQVITDLTSAVKELIENALDAHAKHIQINLKNYGLDSIDVLDDGHGIQEADFPMLGKKHATSKISAFNDIQSLSTYGFRGEAISSLCALGSISISTRHASSAVGTCLRFNQNGDITSQQRDARSVFTLFLHFLESSSCTFLYYVGWDYSYNSVAVPSLRCSSKRIREECTPRLWTSDSNSTRLWCRMFEHPSRTY